MKYQSVIETRGFVTFPEFMAEKVYMREFYKKDGLPEDLCRWQETVDAMLDGVETDGPIYLMIDEGIVQPGFTHRRKGLHIDGYWNPGLSAHGNGHGGGGSHKGNIDPSFFRHGPSPKVGHRPVERGHGGRRHLSFQGHSYGHWGIPTKPKQWAESCFEEPEAIILASTLSAARGYSGVFEGPIGEGGDCSEIDLRGLTVVPMDSDRVYACNVTGLHESLPVSYECKRQLVRLNVPGWSPDRRSALGWTV